MSSAAKQALREVLVWSVAALGMFGLIYYFHDLRTALGPDAESASPSAETRSKPNGEDGDRTGFDRTARLQADARGHFVFDASINDRPVTLMADTGATVVVLTYEDAERLGLSPRSLDFSARVSTANGISRVAPVILDRVHVEDIAVRDVPAAIAEPGALSTNLLGMSFLGRLSRFELSGNELILTQ